MPQLKNAISLALLLLATPLVHAQATTPETTVRSNLLVDAVAWRQTAAEFRALYYQGFNVAKARLDQALAQQKPGDKKPAIISDIDDTILSSNTYWGFLIGQDKEFFDDAVWDRWVAANGPTLTPGALEFLEYAKSRGVEIFYVSSRDQGDKTYEYALNNLRALKVPYADEAHVTILRESSNKEPAQHKIAEQYNVLLMLGDNLNDFERSFYVDKVEQRAQLVDASRSKFGGQYIIFPNPTDGHWLKAIFGESEPADTPANRAKFRDAAEQGAWKPAS
ncbi:5'-nucleotidase, lipoprotein e(P4) family [Pseudomonas sp. BIGb0427]|uniref:5'-nucleotidase, lipoprotein e(P4) family n=1 Tax=unclassified Pseudomonas TaxID=196821 RepID=UPI0016A00564|nr:MULTISPECIES: 5'-nucleotidase, lipoprotein e(P4) family [unclassified Pseudomonas]NLU60120.1 5'-nucleotidase, lipoprotein e(P4) family [Pseudomonas sp. BIGb0427]QPG61365.1 5'-nucleotidase, lipoprotein e(P4) family [Pseudomonas sp. BIGb0427]UVM68881.1 5'-nucleotidase, lipoprotein e(P4) family [Pseudomonas sp. B21-009]